MCIIYVVSFRGTDFAQYSLRVSRKACHRWWDWCWPVVQYVLLAHLLLASYHVRCMLGASSESLFKIVAEENTSTTKLKKLVGKKEKNEKNKLQCI